MSIPEVEAAAERLRDACRQLARLESDQPEEAPVEPVRNNDEPPIRHDPLVSLLDDVAMAVLRIAKDGRSAEDRLQDISKLDQRFWGKDSVELGALLNVKPSRIRQTDWWRLDRPAQLADTEFATPDDI